MSTIKMAGKLPKDWDQNGIEHLYGELVRDPHRSHVVIAIVDTAKITKDIVNYETVPTIRVVAIEPISGEDAGTLRAILQRHHADRTGNLELPAEWESVLADMTSPTLPGTEPRR